MSIPKIVLRVAVADDKYEVIMNEDGNFYALRYGEFWRSLSGDGLVMALAQRIQELEGKP